MSIIVFSRPIRSGKTGSLQKWSKQQNNVQGFLMPDLDGKRHLHNISTGESELIECEDPSHSPEALQQIGRFYFYAEMFRRANRKLLDWVLKEPEWLVLDELGKLEMLQQGFYDALPTLIAAASAPQYTGKLVLVIREGLYEDAIQYFNIPDHQRVQEWNL
jgi:nucleoside-triphosphatase THEP1